MSILSLLIYLLELCISALAGLAAITAVCGIVLYMVIAFIISVGSQWTYSIIPASSKT